MREWASASIPKQYASSLASAIREIKAATVKPPNVVDYKTTINTNHAKQSLQSILNDAVASFNTGLSVGQTSMLRLASVTQQIAISEARVNKAVAQGFIEEGSAIGSKQALRDALLQKAIDGKYITIVNKNGDSVQYNIDSYAEMVARTKLIEASSMAVIDTAQEVGADLVQVSSHNTRCEECAEYEGKIFSISGSDPDFPALDAAPPFHPNCMHDITVVYRSALVAEGSLDAHIAQSNGEEESA